MNNKKTKIAFCILVINLLFPVKFSYSSDSDYDKEFNIGKIFYNEGKYFQAIYNLQKSTQLTENSNELYESYLYLGLSYFIIRNSNYKESFGNAIKIKPSNCLDQEIFSPQIIKEYNDIRDEILKDKNNSSNSKITNFLKTTQKSKFITSIEYSDFLRELEFKTTNTKIANYRFISLKGEYELNEILSGYLEIGNINLALPAQYGYGNNAPGYGAGLIISMNIFRYINLNLRGEYLNFFEKSKDTGNYEKRNTNWNEYRAGIFIDFFKEYPFSPYIGINNFFINGDQNIANKGEVELNNLKFKQVNNESSKEYTAGLKMNLKNYFFNILIKTTGEKQKNYHYISSFKITAGHAF